MRDEAVRSPAIGGRSIVRRLTMPRTARVRGVMTGALAAAACAATLSGMLQAQEPAAGRPASVAGDTTSRGPAFYEVQASDGAHVDARTAPALQRRITLTLIGIPLGMAVQAIADRAGLEATFSPETIPLG